MARKISWWADGYAIHAEGSVGSWLTERILSRNSSWTWPLKGLLVRRWTRLFAEGDGLDVTDDMLAFPWISTSVHAFVSLELDVPERSSRASSKNSKN